MDTIMHLLQFTDSTFPVGTFSFSNGLETAAYEGVVRDARTLEEYTRAVALQAAFSDGVAALLSHRATLADDYDAIVRADRQIMLFKMNDEARMMLQRMGKKLAELAARLFPGNGLIGRWLSDIESGETPGSYPVAQGIVFALAGLDEEQLYASHQYGVVNMVLSAALRCVRVSHYDTQESLFRLSAEVPALYERARSMTFEDMNSFVPEMDIMASLHEKGNMRMFMN
ncbi:MAG: urease accessory protein UreF [Muribaculaceae bacterium]|nr:urease accessory protein UreF [Muribaculaceae bacterium]MDE5930759.1 urease accessory protein UreF [Muribaculaceae bacterium]